MKSKLLKVTTAIALSLTLLSSGVVPSLVSKVSAASVKIDGYTYQQEAVDIMNELNTIRKASGLTADIKLDPVLTQAAQGHATYLSSNNLNSHVQDKTKPNFTGVEMEDRLDAIGGKNFINTFGANYYAEGVTSQGANLAAESLLSAPYHRFPMVDPNLYTVGVGVSGKKVVFMYALKRGVNPVSEGKDILYPFDGQKDINISMLAEESPDPLKGTGLTFLTAGYLVTATLANTSSLSTVPASMTDSKGNKVDVIVKKELDEGTELRTGYSSWIIIPKKPLAYNTNYNMNVNGVKWSFTTKASATDTGNTGGGTNNGGSTGGGTTTTPPTSDGTDKIYISKTTQASKSELLAKPLDPSKKFTTSSVGIRINGDYVTLNPTAKVIDGSTYIPLRGVFEKLGSKVGWFQPLQEITIEHNGKVVELRVGSTTAYVDHVKITLAKAPFIENGSTFIPLRFVSEAIGGTVLWDQASSTVTIVAEFNK